MSTNIITVNGIVPPYSVTYNPISSSPSRPSTTSSYIYYLICNTTTTPNQTFDIVLDTRYTWNIYILANGGLGGWIGSTSSCGGGGGSGQTGYVQIAAQDAITQNDNFTISVTAVLNVIGEPNLTTLTFTQPNDNIISTLSLEPGLPGETGETSYSGNGADSSTTISTTSYVISGCGGGGGGGGSTSEDVNTFGIGYGGSGYNGGGVGANGSTNGVGGQGGVYPIYFSDDTIGYIRSGQGGTSTDDWWNGYAGSPSWILLYYDPLQST